MGKIAFELSTEQRRVAHLIAFSNTLTDEPWKYDGDVVAQKGAGGLTVHGLASWVQHRGECILDANGFFGHHLISNASYGKFIPEKEYVSLSGADGSWKSEKTHVRSTHHPAGGGEIVTLRLFDLGNGDLDKETPSTGLVLAGADLADWPMSFPKDAEGSSVACDGMVTTIFGRDALIRRMATKTDAGHDVLVAFDGGPLETMQQSALWLVMSFLAGRRANVVGSIGIDGDREVWRRRYMWTASLHAAHPPLDAHRWNRATFDMPAHFPKMLDKALALLEEDIPIDVALEHLFADSRGHHDIEIRDITLALDALVEANAFKAKDATVLDPDEYTDLLPTLEKALDDALKGHEKREALVDRLMERLKGANDISHGERRRKFWKRVGFELKPDEKKALGHRHPMSHAGYVLRHAGEKRHQQLADQVRLARTLVNRVILGLLGYDGPVFDYTSGRTEPWQHFIDRDGSLKKKKE